MKHLIETADPSGLPITEYDRIILASATNDVIVRGEGNASVLMISAIGYQLYGAQNEDGQIDYWVFEYTGTEEYNGKEYFKYSLSDTEYILAPTRNVTKVSFPFDDYYIDFGDGSIPLSSKGYDSLYGFTSVPENKVVMKRRTDIGTNANNNAYVDLGLTSGTLWATMNVGATSETDYGDYFMWGSTTPNTNTTCNWINAPFNNGSSSYNSSYFNSVKDTVCPNGVLAKEYDAARANMGGDWKMPSSALIEELISETKNEWVTDYNNTGMNGWKFTSKTDTSKYIFIPASGGRSGSSFYNQGSYGSVWGSSLVKTSYNYALFLRFKSDEGINAYYGETRDHGLVVRGVL